MQEAFLSNIQNQGLVEKGEKILLAVSGGVDSVVMAHLTKGTGYSFDIAHCNFLLRGEDSDEDERFVKALGRELGVKCHIKKFKTGEYAKKKGISVQMAARELRYSWFGELMETKGYDKLALAHHKDDQLETIIFNLTRGTGIAGLTGMQSISGKIIRPLLFADRKMIENYAISKGLKWREDSTNESLKYDRNLIRHKIIDVLKEINPGVLETLDYTLLRLIETESVLNDRLISFIKKSVKKEGDDLYISKSALKSSLFPTLALHGIAGRFGFSYQQCVNIFESINNTGNVFYAHNYVVNVDRTELIISPVETDDFHSRIYEINREDNIVKLIHGSLKISVKAIEDTELVSSREIAFIDYDKLTFPLRARHWAVGDWFIPLGMKGKKKVSDLMIDEKIPLNLKKRVLVIESAGDIIWVIGHRIDNRYRITASTTRVWKAEYEKN